MKVIGIIAEFNPFHFGHKYLIDKVKELYPDSLVIAIISPTFMQRGDISVINKWDKTNICLQNGIDLVVELPTLYATQSADIFASNAIGILNNLNIDTLVFGSECNDISLLTNLVNVQLNSDYDELVKRYLSDGLNYPTAMSKALYDLTNVKIDKPNDLLAISYIKEIIKNKYNITPVAIKRTNDYHGKTIDNNILNASLIRELFYKNGDIKNYVTKETNKYMNINATLDNAFSYLKYNIICNKDSLNKYLSVDEGIENRIIEYINSAYSWQELVNKLKTKRYTYNKINRMLVHILLDIKKEDNIKDTYIRILGFNNNGKSYLNKIKKVINVPIYTNYKFNKSKVLDIEYKATFIYALITNNPLLIDMEYKNKPIIK